MASFRDRIRAEKAARAERSQEAKKVFERRLGLLRAEFARLTPLVRKVLEDYATETWDRSFMGLGRKFEAREWDIGVAANDPAVVGSGFRKIAVWSFRAKKHWIEIELRQDWKEEEPCFRFYLEKQWGPDWNDTTMYNSDTWKANGDARSVLEAFLLKTL
jgi:hypothetical protein